MSDISARIGIEGAKEAVKDLQAVGKAAQKLDGEKVEIKVGADTKKADKDIADVLKKVDKLDGTSAKLLIAANTSAIAHEIADLVQQIDRLDANDPQVDVKAQQLDKLNGDLDQLETKLRSIDDTPIDIDTKPAQKGLDDVGKSADSSKSVLANMVGNATQDLGALGGIAGSAGVAIGQMGEYMVDAANSGDKFGTVVKNFAAVAGPIAAISAGIFLLTSGIQAYQKPAKDAAERTKQLGEAMEEGGDDALNFANVLRENADALANFIADANDPLGGFGTWIDEMGSKVPLLGSHFKEAGVNIFDAAKRAGISVYGLGKQIDGTGESSEQFEARLQAAADAGRITDAEMRAVTEAIDKYGSSAAQAAEDSGLLAISAEEVAAIFNQLSINEDPLKTFPATFKNIMDDLRNGGDIADSTTAAINRMAKELGISPPDVIALAFQGIADEANVATDILNAFAEAEAEAAAATEAHNAALQVQIDRLNERAGVGRTLAEADVAAQQALTEYATVLAEWDKNVKEAGTDQAALNELTWAGRDAAVDNADAVVAQAVAQAAANGTTLKASEGTEIWNDNMVRAAASAKGPLKQSILDYIATTNGIEPSKVTEISALIEQGKIDEAILILDDASKTRDAQITAEVVGATAAQTTLDNIAKARIARVNVQIVATGGKNARTLEEHGGTAGQAGGIAGEAGPEFVRTPGSRRPVLLTDETLVPPGTRVTSAKRTREILRGVRVNRQLPRYANGTGGSGMGTVVVQPITLNAGVVGNRFDVMRAVARAQRDGARVLGTRR